MGMAVGKIAEKLAVEAFSFRATEVSIFTQRLRIVGQSLDGEETLAHQPQGQEVQSVGKVMVPRRTVIGRKRL